MDNDLHCMQGVKANFPGDARMVWHEGSKSMRFNVYRNDYDKQGRPICEALHKEFGGPSCGTTPADAWREACRQIKSISNTSHSWDSLQPIPGIPAEEKCIPGQHDPADDMAAVG